MYFGNRKYLYFLLLAWLSAPVHAQLRFAPTYAGQALEVGRAYKLGNGEEVVFESLRFYISDIQVEGAGDQPLAVGGKYHLMDIEDPKSLEVALDLPTGNGLDALSFSLGIDPATQQAGAMGGDLDPANGMYWAWQSGYIHFKLEGSTAACPARNHKFQFHLGGFMEPNNSVQTIRLPFHPNAETVIELPIDQFLGQFDLSEEYEVMRPCARAVELSASLGQLFRVKP